MTTDRTNSAGQQGFTPSGEWQDVPDGAVLPAGLQIRIDVSTGRKQARLMPDDRASGARQPAGGLDAVTVLRTIDGTACNKSFTRQPDGGVAKVKAKEHGRFVARTVPTPDLAAFKAVLEHEVTDHEDRMVMLGVVIGAPPGEYRIISKAAMGRHLQCDKDDPKVAGWHPVGGHPTVCRTKANFAHSTIRLIDRDNAPGTPPEVADLSTDEYLAALASLLPGVDTCRRLVLPSSSTRVLVDGVPCQSNNCHIFVQLDDATGVDFLWKLAGLRARITAYDSGMPWDDPVPLAFAKPTHDSQTGAVLRHVCWPIFDPTVAGRERLVFDGKPTVHGHGLSVAPPSLALVDGPRLCGEARPLSAREITEIAAATQRITGRRASLDVERKGKIGANGKPQVSDVTEIEHDMTLGFAATAEAGPLTFGAMIASGKDKIRLQSPWRPESTSWAAFFSTMGGAPFIMDMADGVKHVLDEQTLRPARDIILEWARARYDPRHRTRDGFFFSGAERAVVKAFKPDFRIADALKLAQETPRDETGRVKNLVVHVVFNRVRDAVYGELVRGLDFEEASPATAAAADLFEHQLRGLFRQPLRLAWGGEGVGRVPETLPLAVWSLRFAALNPDNWMQVRGYSLWARITPDGVTHEGEDGSTQVKDGALALAFKPDLIAEVKYQAELAQIPGNRITELCNLYGLSTGRDRRIWCRGQQIRAIELASAWVSSVASSYSSADDFAAQLRDVAQKNELNQGDGAQVVKMQPGPKRRG